MEAKTKAIIKYFMLHKSVNLIEITFYVDGKYRGEIRAKEIEKEKVDTDIMITLDKGTGIFFVNEIEEKEEEIKTISALEGL